MINVIKTVRAIYFKLSDKHAEYLAGFSDCLQYVIIGWERDDHHNLHELNRQLANENAVLRSRLHKYKNKALPIDNEVSKSNKVIELEYTIIEKDAVIRALRDELSRAQHAVYKRVI